MDERALVVWTYNFDDIIPACRDFEEKLIQLVWHRRNLIVSGFPSAYSSSPHSTAILAVPSTGNLVSDEKTHANVAENILYEKAPEPTKKKRSCGFGYWLSGADDVEKSADGPSARPIRLFAPFYGGLAAALSVCA